MKKLSIRIIFALLLVAAGDALAVDKPSPEISVGADFKVTKLLAVPVGELWHSSGVQAISSQKRLECGVWKVDEESGDSQKGWIISAFALCGFGDLAEDPVAFRLLSRRRDVSFVPALSVAKSKKSDSVFLVFETKVCDSSGRNCKQVPTTLSISSDEASGKIFVNKKVLGRVGRP